MVKKVFEAIGVGLIFALVVAVMVCFVASVTGLKLYNPFDVAPWRATIAVAFLIGFFTTLLTLRNVD